MRRHILDDPVSIVRKIEEHRRTDKWVSANHSDLRERYAGRWIGAYECGVRADAHTLVAVVKKLREAGVPPGCGVVRLMERDEHPLIL